MAYHYGGFTEFSSLMTNIGKGKHTIVMRVKNTNTDLDTIPLTHVDWFHFGGIIRSVEVHEIEGLCNQDVISLDGKVHDPQRIDFLNRYLIALDEAIESGAKVDGYFQWSFMDNFEWANGYRDRFGLVYINYQTQERIPKDSAYWYKEVMETNGEKLYEHLK